MGSRVRLLGSSDSWWRSPSRSAYYRRESIDQALDAINARTASPAEPSWASRVCRPAPLVLIALVLAGGITAVYFTHHAIVSNAEELHNYITGVVLDSSRIVADRIHDVVLNSTDSIYTPFEPVHQDNTTAATDNTTVA